MMIIAIANRNSINLFGATFTRNVDTSSPMCNEDNETANYLFGECNFAKQVWNDMNFPQTDWSEGYIEVFNRVSLFAAL